MNAFRHRLADAEEFEHAVADALRERGWLVEPFGQALLTPTARDILRGDPNAQHRWLPDLLAYRPARGTRVLVDAKASGAPNYAIEKDALSALVEHERTALMPVYVVFSDWHVARACELWEIVDDERYCRTGPYYGRGSGTPYWLIRKGALPRTFDNTFGAKVGR